ncbi:MAG: M48 family metalloprotease [Xenococcaceae cyanobacterium]
MSMTQAQFEALVRKLEKFSRKQPASYKFRVRMLALLGYVYIIAVLALIVILGIYFFPRLFLLIEYLTVNITRSGRLIALLLLFGIGIPLVLLFVILDALWIYIPAPEGLAVKRRQIPRLFQLIDELRRELQTPPFHHVLMTAEFNAAVAQVPRFGIFGGYQNYLIVGLPLMQTLDPAQFRAVLAHELGHLSGRHGQFGHWIYRVRISWAQILKGFENKRLQASQSDYQNAISSMLGVAGLLGSGIFSSFFNWYVPFFAAYSFVLARADEYEADRYSAKFAGAKNLAAALISLEIKGKYVLQAFWDDIRAKTDSQAELPAPYSELAANMQRAISPENAETWLQSALTVKTDYADTHPCLKDRLAALGCKPNQILRLLKPVKGTAAKQFLGKALSHLVKYFDEEWQRANASQWKYHHNQIQQQQQRLEELEQQDSADENLPAEGQSLSIEQQWERAMLKAKFKTPEEAIPDLKAVLAEYPNHRDSNLILGQILLEQGDRAGIQYLETAMRQDGNIFAQGAKLIYAFLQEHDGEETASQYWQQAQTQYEIVNNARLERARVNHNHEFCLPELSDSTLESIRQQLSQYSDIKAAYLVQKVVKYLPEHPFYVLGIETNHSMFDDRGRSQNTELMEKLAVELRLPGETWLDLLDSERTALKVKFRKMEGALIYPQKVPEKSGT